MLNIKCILHPSDYSSYSNAAFRIACSLARVYGARLVVLHVVPLPVIGDGQVVLPPPTAEETAQLEAELRTIQAPDLVLEHQLAWGEASNTILEVAQAVQCDLLVMGTHGRTGLGRLLMGSVAETVLRAAPCPVLTVKKPSPEISPAEHLTVYTLHDPIRAELIKNALQREGITCLLAGINEASAVGLPGTNILIQVPARSATRARVTRHLGTRLRSTFFEQTVVHNTWFLW